jgi:hypothetical protein
MVILQKKLEFILLLFWDKEKENLLKIIPSFFKDFQLLLRLIYWHSSHAFDVEVIHLCFLHFYTGVLEIPDGSFNPFTVQWFVLMDRIIFIEGLGNVF